MNRFVMKSCVIALAMCVAVSTRGATMCSGESTSVVLDLATGTRTVAASETIRYSTAWVDGAAADATAVVEVNGETLLSMAGSGAVTWTPQHNGNYTLTHKVMSGGAQVGETLTATFAIEKVWTIGDTMGKSDHGFTTSGDGDKTFYRVVDESAPNGEAMKSGAITHSQSSVLSTTVMGPGTLSFSWRTSCEQDDDYEWDHAELTVDGVVKLRLNGVTAWTAASTEITGDGEHTIEWRYVKDDVESAGEDCIWVGGFGWDSAEPYTHTTEVPVPYAWLTANDPDVVDEYESYEAAAKKTAANGWKVWECYLVGVSPADETAEFTAKIEMHDGAPVVTWEPDLNTNGVVRTYKVYGSETLENGGEWQYPTNSLHRFFKVTVEMP